MAPPPRTLSTYDLHLKRPGPKQALFIASPAKRKIIRAGRRGGKTVGAAIYAALKFKEGRRILYAAPTSDQLKRFWFEVCRFLRDPIDAGVLYKNETDHIIEVKGTNIRIRAKTAWNANTLRGDFADLLILDEFQLMNEDAWGEVGAPMLIDNNGDAVFIYTPPSLHSRDVSKATDPLHAAKMYKKALADGSGRWFALHWTSHDNPALSVDGLNEVAQDMTRLAYRQEILAEDITEVPGALWTLEMIEATRVTKTDVPELIRIVVGVDPSGSSTNEAGIAAAGIARNGHAYVLADASLKAASPRNWAARAVALYHDLQADRVLGERNYGGDMVKETIYGVDENVSYRDVTATRGKLVRAEPVAARYEQLVVHHVGVFPDLEEEMCSYVEGNDSPNRMDALVWCLTELLGGGQTLGLLNWFRSGGAERELARLETSDKVARVTLKKPVIAAKAPVCPKCGSEGALVQTIAGGQRRCAQCGEQWWPDEAAKPYQATRGEYLSKITGRRG